MSNVYHQTGQASRSASFGNTAHTIKSSGGKLHSIHLNNGHATAEVWFKVYDKAVPTSSDTPVATFMVGPENERDIRWNGGVRFGTGIGIRCTALIGDSDTTDASASASGTFFYS